MARKPLYRSDRFAYHVCSRSNNKEWFYIPQDRCWQLMVLALGKAARKYGAEIHAFVLMMNHFHLILSTPEQNLDDFMRYFLSAVTRLIQNSANRINHVFGLRYRWTVLESSYSLAYVLKYVFRNPVRAGIFKRVEDYPYSTLTSPGDLPLMEGFGKYWEFIPKDPILRLHWLNLPATKEQEEVIGRALRRFHFKFTTNSNLQKLLRGLKRSYGINEPD